MDRCVLKQYKDLVAEIAELRADLEKIETEMIPDDVKKRLFGLRERLYLRIDKLLTLREEIERSLESLSSLERRVIRKRYLWGMTGRMIAAELKMSADNVKRIQQRALAKIERGA
ncbi:MAG: hypothetical protein IJF43_01715 [Firmicutes bacterium]|nr:hypothetical protein [Bacillota bacterium]